MIFCTVTVKVIDEAIFSGFTREGIGKGKRVKEVSLKSLKENEGWRVWLQVPEAADTLKRMTKNCGPQNE